MATIDNVIYLLAYADRRLRQIEGLLGLRAGVARLEGLLGRRCRDWDQLADGLAALDVSIRLRCLDLVRPLETLDHILLHSETLPVLSDA